MLLSRRRLPPRRPRPHRNTLMLATSGAPSQPRSPDGHELIDALPDAFLDALGDAVREMRQQGERELERIGAEARARDAELRAIIAEQRAEILVLKAEF